MRYDLQLELKDALITFFKTRRDRLEGLDEGDDTLDNLAHSAAARVAVDFKEIVDFANDIHRENERVRREVIQPKLDRIKVIRSKIEDGGDKRIQSLMRVTEERGTVSPDCSSCLEHYEYMASHGSLAFAPTHNPSPMCESGQHPHCTCDTCF